MLSSAGDLVLVLTGGSDHRRAARTAGEQRTGLGVQEWADGSRYEGEFVDGLKHGRGKYTWKSGQCYEGSFYKDFRHGDGVHCWPSGHKFIGKFYLNRKEGYGQYLFPDGSDFQGLYHRDQRFGPGVLTYPDDHQDVGLWHSERLFRLCTTLEEGFTLQDFPEYSAFAGASAAAEERVPLSPSSQKDAEMNQIIDDCFILPPGIEYYSTNGDHLPLPPGRKKELDRHFFGELWKPDVNPNPGYRRDPLSTLPLEARIQAHIHNHRPETLKQLILEHCRARCVTTMLPYNHGATKRLQGQSLGWNVDAVLALKRTGFGPKGPLELRSELLIRLASQGQHKAVAHLIRTGLVYPDVTDGRKCTALMAAVVNCCNRVIHVLLDMGVEIDKLNSENMSALAMCHILYFPFHSLHVTEPQQFLSETSKVIQLKSVEPWESTSADDRAASVETVQTHSHVFSEEAMEEHIAEVPRHSEVSSENELATEHGEPAEIEPPSENECHPQDLDEETQEQQIQEKIQEQCHETEITETEEVINTEELQSVREEAKDNTACDMREEEPQKDVDVVGVDRSIDVVDGKIVVGSVHWTEYPAKGKIQSKNETPTFYSMSSVNSFQIHVPEEAMHRAAEALSRTGITPSLDSQETVRKMAALKIKHRERLKTLQLLLDRGADPNACRVPMPVLFLAVMASDDEALKRLLMCGARTDIPLPPERKGLYPLHVAASLPGPAGPKITELLLHAMTDPDARASDQDDIYRFDQENKDPVRASVDTRNREGGRTALHLACQRDYDYQNASKIVALLLSHGARTDLLWSGHSPLSLAIASGNEMAMEELLKAGADPNVALGDGVASALCALANNNYHSCGNRQKLLDLLVKGGADILMPVLVDNVERTAADYAHYSWRQDIRISTTPYHALNIQEREIYKERQQLLKMMTKIQKQTEKERQLAEHESDGTRECNLKSWNEGQRLSEKSPLPQSPKHRAKEGADAAQRNDFRSQGGVKGTLKSKTLPRDLGVMSKPRITKLMNFDVKPRSLRVTESAANDIPKENYSYI